MQSLPSRQMFVPPGKFKVKKRQTPGFSATFPEESIVPQNTPRENGYERPESWPWKKRPPLRSAKLENHSRPVSQNEVIGGCGGLSVSPNMDFGKTSPAEKGLPPIATIHHWREISPDLLKRDAACQNVLCKHCPQIGSHSERQYFQRVTKWRKGIVSENEKRSYTLYDYRKITTKPIHFDQKVTADYDSVISRLSYTSDYYNQFAKDKKISERSIFSPTVQLSRKKDLQEKRKFSSTPPTPPGSALAQNMSMGTLPAVETPDTEYLIGKVARYLEMYVPNKRCIHPKCQPLDKIFEPASQNISAPLKIVYKRKALPGFLQKKTKGPGLDMKDNTKCKTYKCEVGNLGLMLNLPEYNPNLVKRHVSIPRSSDFTRSSENEQNRRPLINQILSTPISPFIPRIMKPL